MVDAFGIFYLTDVDNEKHGGTLVLHDPAFHGVFNFHEARTYDVATKKNRLVICPNHIWHEVKQYLADDERITIVVNLNAVTSHIKRP
jgi:Rps23 Pro-64 3,4-dihydroxylase Tpa1-like proline 4-hydroxylase